MSSKHPIAGLARIGALAFAVAACAGVQPSPTSTSVASPTIAPSPSPTAAATSTVAPTPGQTPIWTLIDGEMPIGVVTQVARESLVAGDHGGGNTFALPARVLVDYRVAGTCQFSVAFYSQAPGTSTASATLKARATAQTISETWAVQLSPGSYEINPNATDGCTFLITVRTAPTTDPSGKPIPESTPVLTMIDGDLPAGVLQQTARTSLTQGGHGLGNFIPLPSSFLVDYTVSGSCAFSIVIWSEAGGRDAPIAVHPVDVQGGNAAGTWSVGLYPPGLYAVDPAGWDGCTYVMTVRAA